VKVGRNARKQSIFRGKAWERFGTEAFRRVIGERAEPRYARPGNRRDLVEEAIGRGWRARSLLK
jgi:hypothetical protein